MSTKRELLERIHEILDIPVSYYEKAVARYRSLGKWFCRDESCLARFSPAVYPQGSFRLGTVIRPLLPAEEYDIDVVCELVKLTKKDLAQKQLKELVGVEVKSYATSKGFSEPAREKKRCWRLDYADEVNFHIDILGCLPEDEVVVAVLVEGGVDRSLAEYAVALTCNEHEEYEVVTDNWPSSNPAGYAKWFENRMEKVARERRQLLVEGKAFASVDEVPTYALKTPLQRSVQLLKRHRDVMFRDESELKPISMLITTLAAHAYQGETSIDEAMRRIIEDMTKSVGATSPRVPNPVNPAEDFADGWTKPRIGRKLEESFYQWHQAACRDFEELGSLANPELLKERVEGRWGAVLGLQEAREFVGNGSPAVIVAAPAAVEMRRDSPRPWAD